MNFADLGLKIPDSLGRGLPSRQLFEWWQGVAKSDFLLRDDYVPKGKLNQPLHDDQLETQIKAVTYKDERCYCDCTRHLSQGAGLAFG